MDSVIVDSYAVITIAADSNTEDSVTVESVMVDLGGMDSARVYSIKMDSMTVDKIIEFGRSGDRECKCHLCFRTR